MPAMPNRDIGLCRKILLRAIIAVIVHDQEMADTKRAVMRQEKRQAQRLVSHCRKDKYVIRLNQ